MAPYGYDPMNYRKDYGFVAGATNAIASGVIGFTEEQKQKKALEVEYAKAEKMASEKKELINYSYKTLRNLASRKIDKLIELGDIKPEEKPAMLKVLVQPDKFTNFKDYYQVNGTAFDELSKSLDEKITKAEQIKTDQGIKQTIEGGAQQPAIGFQNPETEAVSGDLGASMADPTKASEATQQTQPQGPWAELGTDPEKGGSAPTQQQPIQAIGQQHPVQYPTKTKEEAGWDLAGKYTKGQTEGSLAFQSLKSSADIAKQKKSEEDMKFKRDRLDFDKNRENRLKKNDALGWANLNLNKEKFEQFQSSTLYKDLDTKLRLMVNADTASAETEGEISDLEEKIANNKQKAESKDAKIDPAIAESIESEISKQTGELSKKRDKLRGQIEKVIKYEDEYNKSTEALRKYAEKLNEKGPTSKYTEAKVEATIAPPAAAPAPTGAGTPAPVIGGASPKLPPRSTSDTAVGAMAPGSAPLQGSQKSKIPAYNSLEEATAAGKKPGDVIRVKINGNWKLIKVK